ncbi:MAG: ABC transporter substrate-binding protein [Gammaproteobacteria bacterium]
MIRTARFTIVILALFFCAVTSNAAEPTRIQVGVPTLSMVVIAFTAAKEKGYYKEEGLDVELVWMSAPVAAQALIGGNVQFATVSGSAIAATLAGLPLRFIFSSYQRPMFWLFSKPEIKHVRELKGKRVGVSGIGSGPATLLVKILKKHGLEGGRDVPILALGRMPDIAAGLFSGTVDAAMLAPPFNIAAKESGFRELVSFLNEDFVELQGSIVVREELLKSKPTLVEKFTRATLKGLMYAREHRSGTIPILVRYLKIGQTQAEKYYDSVREVMTRDGTVNDELLQKFYQYAVERFKVKNPSPIDQIFDYSLTKKLNSQLQAAGWRPKP